MKRFLINIYDFLVNYRNIKNSQKKIKKNKKNIIFQISTLYSFEIIKDLYLELKKEKNYNLILSIDSFEKRNINYLKKYEKKIIPSVSIKYLKNIDLFIKTSYEIFGPRGTKQILIFHGFPVKNTSIKKEYINNINYYFISSELEKSVYKFISKNHIKENQFKKIGYTKLDKLFKKKYKLSFKYKKRKKNIIYAPSWDHGTSLRTYGTNIIKLIAENNLSNNLFVKPHPALLESPLSHNFNFYTGGIDWKKKILFLKKKYKNIYFVEDNLVDLIKIGDLLITDISGAALEFIYFNKSVIFVESPEFYKITQNKRSMNSHLSKNSIMFNAGRSYGIKVNSLSDLLSKINSALRKKNNFNFRKKFPYYNEKKAINTAIKEIKYQIESSSNKSSLYLSSNT